MSRKTCKSNIGRLSRDTKRKRLCRLLKYEQRSLACDNSSCFDGDAIFRENIVRSWAPKKNSFLKYRKCGLGNKTYESTGKTDTEDNFLAPDGTQDSSRDFESLENHEEPEQKRRKTHDDAILRNALHCMKTLLDTGAKRDEHSIFGEHIANKIRSCNRNNSEINIAQHHIENIVFNLCAGAYKGVAVVADDQTASIPTNTVILPKMEPEP